MAPFVSCDLTVVFCFHDHPVCLQREIISFCRFPPHFPSSQIPTVNSGPHPGIVLPLHAPVPSTRAHQWTHIQSKVHRHEFSVWLSLYSDYHRSAVSPSFDKLKCFHLSQPISLDVRVSTLLELLHPWVQVCSCLFSSTLFLFSFILPSHS